MLSDVEMHCNSTPMTFYRSRSFIDLGLRSFVCLLRMTSSLKLLGQFELNFICSLQAKGERKFIYLVKVT